MVKSERNMSLTASLKKVLTVSIRIMNTLKPRHAHPKATSTGTRSLRAQKRPGKLTQRRRQEAEALAADGLVSGQQVLGQGHPAAVRLQEVAQAEVHARLGVRGGKRAEDAPKQREILCTGVLEAGPLVLETAVEVDQVLEGAVEGFDDVFLQNVALFGLAELDGGEQVQDVHDLRQLVQTALGLIVLPELLEGLVR